MRSDRWASSWGCCGPLGERSSVWCHRDLARKAWRRALGRPQSGGVTIRMIGFDGRHQWRRQKLFKLRAKPLQDKISLYYNMLVAKLALLADSDAHPKFAFRSFLVRRTRNEQVSQASFFRRFRSPPSSASARFPDPASFENRRSSNARARVRACHQASADRCVSRFWRSGRS